MASPERSAPLAEMQPSHKKRKLPTSTAEPCRLCNTASDDARMLTVTEVNNNNNNQEVPAVVRICSGCLATVDALDAFRRLALWCNGYVREQRLAVHLCRFCLQGGRRHGRPNDVICGGLMDDVRTCLGVEIDSKDLMNWICKECTRNVQALVVFRSKFATDFVHLYPGSFEKEPVMRSRTGCIPAALQSQFEAMEAGLNFGLRHSDEEPKLQVIFETHFFKFGSFHANKTSLWKCVHSRLQYCKATIEINAEMSTATALNAKHRHLPEVDILLRCPQGKGLTSFNGSEHTFWLSYGTGTHRSSQLTRMLFLNGHKFILMRATAKGTSLWYCTKCNNDCAARLSVKGIIDQIEQKVEHNHEPMEQEELEDILRKCQVDSNSTEPIAAFRRACLNQSAETAIPNSLLQRKLTYNGHDFWLQSVKPNRTEVWRCLWHELRSCPVSIRVKGKKASLENATDQHNHPNELIGVYLQPDGVDSIFDKHERTEFDFWLFSSDSDPKLKRREIVYQGYRYLLVKINDSGDSEWKCPSCEAYLQITGLFWTASQQLNHSHSPLTIEEITLTTGNINVSNLLPYKSPSTSVPLSTPSLITLLSTPNPIRNFQLHHHANNLKILQDGFEYFYLASKPSYSLYRCIYSTIRCCNGTLRIDNTSQTATLSEFTCHNHAVELWDLYYTALGPHTILEEPNNTVKPFHFLIIPTFMRPLPHLIYEKHLFRLDFITESGNRSTWGCAATGCCVRLIVTGAFGKVLVEGRPHAGEPLNEQAKEELIRRYGTASGV